MNIVRQSHEIWGQIYTVGNSPEKDKQSLLESIFKHIERVGRVCYKSEDKITKDSAKTFVDRLIASEHYAMLEHGTVYLTIPCRDWRDYGEFMESYGRNPYTQYDDSECNWAGKRGNVYVTTNYRVLVENGWLGDALDCISIPTPKHPKRITVHFVTNRQVSHELVRHRKMSFAQESTRYCNYTKSRFGSELTFIAPCWLDEKPNEPKLLEDPQYLEATKLYSDVMDKIEFTYDQLVRNYGWKPQQVATILPNSLKTEIVVTGFASDWKHLLDLRYKGTTGAPHPMMLQLMTPVYAEFDHLGLLKNG